MKMYVAGQWTNGRDSIDVLNPYDGSVVDTVPRGSAEDVNRALASAERGAKVMAELTGFERYEILHRAGDLILRDQESLARMLTQEEGKIISEARFEVSRAAEILYLSAEEAKRLGAEVIPLDGGPGRARQIRLHRARALRRRGGGVSVQLPAAPRLSQSRPRDCGGQCGGRQAGHRYPPHGRARD